MNTNSDTAILLLDDSNEQTTNQHLNTNANDIMTTMNPSNDELQFHSFTPTSNTYDTSVSVGGSSINSNRNSSSNVVTTSVYSRSTFDEEDENALQEDDAFLGVGNDGDRSGKKRNDADTSTFAFWQWEYLARYFDVTTNQVMSRILYSLLPITGLKSGSKSNNYIETHIQPNPDLYGPIWISATLIFSMAICGNIANYFKSWELPDDKWQDWHYDYAKVGLAASTITLYVCLVPLALWFFFWFRGCTTTYTLFETVSAYGYSLSVYIPISIMWLINMRSVQLLLVCIGTLMSGSVLCMSFAPVVHSDPAKTVKSSYVILILIILMHALLAFAFLEYFF